MLSKQFNTALKVFAHYDRLKNSLKNKTSIPVSIEFDITNRCNYACFNCTWKEYIKESRTHMPKKDIMRIIRDCASVGIRAIIFSGGGEPLLHPAVSDAMRLAKRTGLNIGLFTNGLLLEGEVAKVVAESCDWVRFNLAAVTPEVYKKYHGVSISRFKHIENNIVKFNELTRHSGSKTIAGIGSTINYINFNDTSKLADFAYQAGCKYFQAKHDFTLLKDTVYLAWWKNTAMPIFKELESQYAPKQFSVDYTETDYLRKPLAQYCYVHHLAAAINADGDVAYCKRLRDRKASHLGNARRQSLKSIFTGDRNRKLCQEIIPQNCGVICPYLELNDFIASSINAVHPNFF